MIDQVSAKLVLKGLELALGSIETEVTKERLPVEPLPEIIMNSLPCRVLKAAGYNESKRQLRIEKRDGKIEDYFGVDPYFFYQLFRTGDPYAFYVHNIQELGTHKRFIL